jgi:hypothetical protein
MGAFQGSTAQRRQTFKGGAVMTTITRHLAQARRVISWLTLVIAIVAAPAWAILEDAGVASATPTASTQPFGGTNTGPNYWSITGARVGAPGEQEVSSYGGSHKHLWVEQQLYGPGVVFVPHVDTSVHQSR